MQDKVSTVIISDDSATRELLRMFVNQSDSFQISGENSDYSEIYESLSSTDKSLLIVDVSKSSDDKLDFVLKVTGDIKNCRVLCLSDNPSVDLIVKVMRAGAKEFLALPLIKSELFEAFDKIKEDLFSDNATKCKCKIISIFSNKGGIGKTSIASNLALELANITKEKVALVDMNFQLGDITTFMNVKPSFDISYMLQNLDKINENFLLSTLEKYKNTSLYVLADPPFFKQAADISTKQISRLFNILKETFSYIIVDAEASFDAKNVTALSESDLVFLVTIANIPALRNSQRCLELFDKLGFDKSKTQILLNRYMENDEISVVDVENVLNKKVYWKIPNNYFTMMSAINKGVPVSDVNEDSNVAKSYKELALYLTDSIYKEKLVKKFENILK